MGSWGGSADEPTHSGKSFKDIIIDDIINKIQPGDNLNRLITDLPTTPNGINRFIEPGKRESQTPGIIKAGDFRFLR